MLGSLGLTLSVPPVLAQSRPFPPGAASRDTSQDNELLLAGDTVVVSATKTPERISDSPAAVTVITEAQIQRSAAKTVPDLLRSVPGVDVFAPNQSQQNVSIRGFNDQYSNTLLVMIDGRPIYQDFYGAVFWNQEPLLLSRIKRIEVVRGPGSALYGANAFNGVINIITKTPQEMTAPGTHGDATGARGGHDSTFAEANVAQALGGGWTYVLGGGYHASGGTGPRLNGVPVDRYATPIVMADVQKALPQGSLRLAINATNAQADYDSIFLVQNGDWSNANYTLTYDTDKSSAPALLRAFANVFQVSSLTFGSLAGRTYGLDLQQQRDLAAHSRLVCGLSYRASTVQGVLTSDQLRLRQSWSGFAQDEARLTARTSLFAGVRLDDNSTYGTNLSPRLSLVHHLSDTQTVRLAYATAFRAPTLLEDYFNQSSPVIPGLLNLQVSGNPNLRPEELNSLEAGYRRDMRDGYIGLDAFTNHITGLIAPGAVMYAPSPPLPPGIPTEVTFRSLGSGQAAGLEVEGGFPLPEGLRGEMNYAYQNVSAGGQWASLSPRSKANLSVETRDGSRLHFRSDLHYVDRSVYVNDFMNDQVSNVGAYFRLDAKIGYSFGPASRPTTVSLAVTNLLGDGHREFPDVPSPLGGSPQSFPQYRTAWGEASTRW